MELQCKAQNYDWGKLGSDSVVASLIASADPNANIDPSKPYAELWMGTHPNGPSLIIERNVLLSDYIKDNVDAIGPDVRKEFGVAIPFLLKVLSIRKALSIQAHPNKKHAESLYESSPDLYKDPNHKPELAIALTPFEALCGFRELKEIKNFIQKIPELAEVLTKQSVDLALSHRGQGEGTDNVIRELFGSLMNCKAEIISKNLNGLLSRLQSEDAAVQYALQYPLLKQLHSDFPEDVGCWAIYLLNYLQLQPGEAIFLGPNLPHAYLSGDCIECMACSDNVVRAGLTPKLRDVPTLLSMLDYESRTRDQLVFQPHLEDPYSCIWRPPVPDFAVIKIRVDSSEGYNTRLRASPSLLIVVGGAGEARDSEPVALQRGTVLFLKASRQLTLTPAPGDTLEIYQAICNVL